MANLPRDDVTETIFRDYAWNYFRLHADQRLRIFQFNIAVSTALVGGAGAAIKLNFPAIVLIYIGILLVFFSFIFWQLDVRTKWLVKNAENAIKVLDARHELPREDGGPNRLELFARDDFDTDKTCVPFKLGYFSYRICFNLVFMALGGTGLAVLVCGTIKLVGQ